MCICFFSSSKVFAQRGLTCRFLTLCSANKSNYIITKLKVDYKYSFLFFSFNYTASWNSAAIKAKASQPLYQGDVGYGATVNSLSFSSLYISQLSSTKVFSENWWQFRIYWIPVDKNTLSDILEIIVFCVFNNPENCWLFLTTSLLCFEPPSSADVCPGGGEGRAALSLSLQAHGSPAGGKFWWVQRPVQGLGTTLRADHLCSPKPDLAEISTCSIITAVTTAWKTPRVAGYCALQCLLGIGLLHLAFSELIHCLLFHGREQNRKLGPFIYITAAALWV